MCEPGLPDDVSSPAAMAHSPTDDTTHHQGPPMMDVLRSPRAENWRPANERADESPVAPVVIVRPDEQVVVPSQHVAQFYETVPFLLDTVREFLSVSLRSGQAAVVIATPAHRAGIEERLVADGLDLDGAVARGQYVALDAGETLAAITVDGAPNAEQFEAVVGGVIAQAMASYQHVRAFGEMVALLAADGQYEAAIHLERLWNDLRQTWAFSLLC